MFGGGKEVILTEQEQRAAMAAAEASAREGTLQSQIDMLREKNELMSKEVTKLRRKAERAQGETEAARAEASLYTSIKPSPARVDEDARRSTPRGPCRRPRCPVPPKPPRWWTHASPRWGKALGKKKYRWGT